MKFILILLSILTTGKVASQVVKQPLILQYTPLGAYSKNFSDIFSATSNQASLASLKASSFGVYGERRFMLDDLNAFAAIIAVPTSSGTIGFESRYFGSSLFNETQIGFMYGRKISKYADGGVKFNYHMVRVPGYGKATSVNFEAGAIFHLTEKIHTGVHMYNPTGSNLGKSGAEKLASVFCLAIGYEASEKVFLSTEIRKHEGQRAGVNAAIQYNLHTHVFIRSGISTLNDNNYLSVSLKVDFGRIDFNTAYHPKLGITPGILLLLNLKKTEEE